MLAKLVTSIMITGVFMPDYYAAGDYYQIDVDCIALDGCGDAINAILALTADGNQLERLEQLRHTYSVGSIHQISSGDFSLRSGTITFYRPETTLLDVTEIFTMEELFSAALTRRDVERQDKPVIKIFGIVTEKRILTTKAGQLMAFVTLDQPGTPLLVLLPEAYTKYQQALNSHNRLIFSGKPEYSDNGDLRQIIVSEVYACNEGEYSNARP